MHADGTVRTFSKCMDADGARTATTNSPKIELWDGNGSGGQRWTLHANGSLRNPESGRCLDTPAANLALGTDLKLSDCNRLWPRQWNAPV
jgi:hypothetical protein